MSPLATVADLMTRDVLTLAPELPARDAMTLLAARHVTGAPVMAGARVLGVVTLTDLVQLAAILPAVPTWRREVPEPGEPPDALAFDELVEGEAPPSEYFTDLWADGFVDTATRLAVPDAPEWSALDECTVSDAMTRQCLALAPDTPLDEAAQFLQRHGVHRALVMEGTALRGILSASDLVRAVARGVLAAGGGASTAATAPEDRAAPLAGPAA
jgi:CBS domain-containing protein